MQTIAIVNEKGGTAKTTTSVNLAAALGELGRKVLLVDLDGQAASSRWLCVEEDARLADAMVRGHGLEPIPNVLPNVDLAPASGRLDSVSHELRPTQGGQLRKILAEVKDRYDYIFIDCPPSLGNRLIGNALLAASHVIVPVETSILALDGLRILLTTLDDIRDGFDHRIVLGGVLACRFDPRTRLSRLVLEELQRALPGKVFQTIIRENVRMRECPASGQSILTFAPDSHAAEDYRSLAREVEEKSASWQQAAEEEAPRGDIAAQFSLDNLRGQAAARVRQSVRNATWHKAASPSRPAEAPEDGQGLGAQQVPPPQEAAEPQGADNPPDSSEPPQEPAEERSAAAETAAEVEREPRDGLAEEEALQAEQEQELKSWLDRLAEAERRLAAERQAASTAAADPPDLAAEGLSQSAPAPQAAAAQEQDQPAPPTPAQPAVLAGPLPWEMPTFENSPAPAEGGGHAQEDPSAPDREGDYPALRAYLERLAKEGQPAAGQDDSQAAGDQGLRKKRVWPWSLRTAGAK